MYFTPERRNCMIERYEKNFFVEREESSRTKIEPNICVTALTVLHDDVLAYSLSNNFINI